MNPLWLALSVDRVPLRMAALSSFDQFSIDALCRHRIKVLGLALWPGMGA